MKYFFFTVIILLTSNCSLNKDSQYWTENSLKQEINDRKLDEILKKGNEITTMTLYEYEIYIDDYTKKSKYPDISK